MRNYIFAALQFMGTLAVLFGLARLACGTDTLGTMIGMVLGAAAVVIGVAYFKLEEDR